MMWLQPPSCLVIPFLHCGHSSTRLRFKYLYRRTSHSCTDRHLTAAQTAAAQTDTLKLPQTYTIQLYRQTAPARHFAAITSCCMRHTSYSCTQMLNMFVVLFSYCQFFSKPGFAENVVLTCMGGFVGWGVERKSLFEAQDSKLNTQSSTASRLFVWYLSKQTQQQCDGCILINNWDFDLYPVKSGWMSSIVKFFHKIWYISTTIATLWSYLRLKIGY